MTRLFLHISAGILIALVLSSAASVWVLNTFVFRQHRPMMPQEMEGAGRLVAEQFRQIPADRWPAEAESVARIFGAPARLVENTSAEAREAAPGPPPTGPIGRMGWGGPRMYVPLPDGAQMLIIGPFRPPDGGPPHAGPPDGAPPDGGPPEGGRPGVGPLSAMTPGFGPPGGRPPGHSTPFLVSVGVTLPIVGIIGFLVTYPVVRRLKALELAATRIAAGDLQARAPATSADAVGSLAQRFNFMAGKVQELLEGQRRLLQAVSHELRTPISRIGFTVEMLADDATPASRAERVASIQADLNELEQLTAELLLYCRLDAQDPYSRREPIAVVEAVTHLVEQCGAAEAGKRATVYAADAADLKIAANRRYFDRAIQNLLSNAARYARRDVVVRVQPVGGQAMIEICDDGPGIAPADRARVFEPFARLDDSRSRESGGVGLGLAIVRRIVEAHGGTIELSDGERGGARFIVGWPIIGADEQASQRSRG